MKTLKEQKEFVNNMYPEDIEAVANISWLLTLLSNMEEEEYEEIIMRSEQEEECYLN